MIIWNLMNEQNTFRYKIISLILFSKRGAQFVVSWEIDWETYTQRGDVLLPHIFFRSRGVPTLAPPCKPRHLWLAACPLLDSWFSSLCLNLTAWLSHGLLVTYVWPPTPSTAIVLFTNDNVTACQSTWVHLERIENPCHMIYNISTKPSAGIFRHHFHSKLSQLGMWRKSSVICTIKTNFFAKPLTESDLCICLS